MTKCKRSWYSVFVNLTLLNIFLSSASGNLILCAPCNWHPPKWFFNTSSLLQPCKEYWQKYFCRCHYYRYPDSSRQTFPRRTIPQRTFLRRTVPRRTISQTDNSPERTFPRQTVPRMTFPQADISPNGHFPEMR